MSKAKVTRSKDAVPGYAGNPSRAAPRETGRSAEIAELIEIVGVARRDARQALLALDVDEPFVVKIKPFKGRRQHELAHAWALYRSRTQFKSRATFWVNVDLFQLLDDEGISRTHARDVVKDSLLHEYGHVIAEWASLRDQELHEVIAAGWSSEEDFAESFAMFAARGVKGEKTRKPFVRVIDGYKSSLMRAGAAVP